MKRESPLLRFFNKLVAFRHAHSVLRGDKFVAHRDYVGSGKPDIRFHGTLVGQPDWAGRCLAFQLCGEHATPKDDDIYVAINMFWHGLPFQVPAAPEGKSWKIAINTSMPSPEDIYDSESCPRVDSCDVIVGGRSITVLVAKQ